MQDGQWCSGGTGPGAGGGWAGERFCGHDGSTHCRAGRISPRERLGCKVCTAVDAWRIGAVPRSNEATGVQEGQGGMREEGRATFRSR
jgi:hypothetical protein